MLERRWYAVPPQLLTSDGQVNGQITVVNTALFKVKQIVRIVAGPNSLELEVKRVDSITIMFLGPKGGSIDARVDLSAFTTGLGAFLFADEQERSKVPEQVIERLTYEEEPVVARRTVLVDKYGNKYDDANPLPVNASVSIGDIEVDVDLDGFSALDPDSVQVTGSQDGSKTGTKFGLVYNRRQQVLAAHDRVEAYTYADFGTKNQRITRVDYTSATFSGITVRREFNYVLDGNRYRRTTSPWTIV